MKNDLHNAISDKDLKDLAQRGKEDFYFFSKGILGYDWLDKRIHLPLCRSVSAPDARRTLTVLPRGWLKSTIMSISRPMWKAVQNPNSRHLIVQNTFTNACKKLASIRGHFESNHLLRALYPEVLPTKECVWKTEALCLNRTKGNPEATFEAAGVKTAVVSRHYDTITEDDTVAPDFDEIGADNLVPTKEDIAQAIGWHRLAIPLLVNPSSSEIHVVGTRWFEEDLISHILKNEPLTLKYLRSCRETNGQTDENGDVTYPERFPEAVLEELKQGLGPYLYSCLYLNKPIRSGDMLFSPDWFLYYETEPRSLLVYTTVDLGGDPEDTKGNPDPSVVLTCGKDMINGGIYILDYWRSKASPKEVIDAIFTHVRKWNPVSVGVEAVALQKMLLYFIRERMREEGHFFSLKPINQGRKPKNARILGLQPMFFSGRIFMRRHMHELQQEMLSFPYGANDDVLDTLAMQLEFWRTTLSKREAQDNETEKDIFSLDAAIQDLRDQARVKTPLGSSMDLFNFEPSFV